MAITGRYVLGHGTLTEGCDNMGVVQHGNRLDAPTLPLGALCRTTRQRGQEGGTTRGNATTSLCITIREWWSERMTRGRCDKRQRNNQPVR